MRFFQTLALMEYRFDWQITVVLVFILLASCHPQRISRKAVYNDGWEMIDAAKAVVSQISIEDFKTILDEESEDVS